MLTVVIPIYNVEKYIEQCIESIINQTYRNLQIILVDDSSPDNCPAICDEYAKKDRRIKVIHKENGGLSSARNEGLKYATGEYICFIDGDDIIELNMFQHLINLAEIYEADIVGCDLKKFKNNIKQQNETQDFKEEINIYSSQEALLNMFKNNELGWNCTNKIFKYSLFNDIIFPIGYLCEDKATAYKLYLKSTKIIYTNKKLYNYRLRENSIMNTKSTKYYIDTLNINTELENNFKKINLNLYHNALAYSAKSALIYYSNTLHKPGYENIELRSLNELSKKYNYVKYANFITFFQKIIIYFSGLSSKNIITRKTILFFISKIIKKIKCD